MKMLVTSEFKNNENGKRIVKGVLLTPIFFNKKATGSFFPPCVILDPQLDYVAGDEVEVEDTGLCDQFRNKAVKEV